MIPAQQFKTEEIEGIRSVCPLCHDAKRQRSYLTTNYAPTIVQSHTHTDSGLFESFFRYCTTCDFGYFYPLPDDRFFNSFYNSTTIESSHEEQTQIAERSQKRRNNWTDKLAAEVLTFIASHNINIEKIRNGRSLDVGSGEGDFLGYANAAGFHVEAVEPIPANCIFIEEQYKTKAFCGMLEDMPSSENGQFSFIYSSHSLEHHKSPLKTLYKFYDLLCDGGVLFISVPNLNSFAFQLAPLQHPYFAFPAHINYFSSTSMKVLLEKIGFTNIDTITTTNPGQILYCWEAGIKSGDINLSTQFYDDLRDKGQHENLFIFATKGNTK